MTDVAKPVPPPDDSSTLSNMSSSSRASASSLSYDSGNFSSTSYTAAEADCRILELENERLKSDLERLTKSEKWYKAECKKYKRLNLETLNKYYLKKSESVQKVQQLQEECAGLEEVCRQLRKERIEEHKQSQRFNGERKEAVCTDDFEVEQLRRTVQEHENLICLLRKQKQILLDELECLAREKDAQALLWQKKNVQLEIEIGTLRNKSNRAAKIDFLQTLLAQQASKVSFVEKERDACEEMAEDISKVMDMAEKTGLELEARTAEVAYLKCLLQEQNSSRQDLQILNKVLQSEHNKHLQRYQVHIRTLLSQTDGYRKRLKSAELKCAELAENHRQTVLAIESRPVEKCDNCAIVTSKLQLDQEKLQSLFQLMEELIVKYESNRRAMSIIKHQLETDRKQFDEIECPNPKRFNEKARNNINALTDDYKKFICAQTNSPPITKIPSEDAINDLIERSRNCVPNLTNLTNNVSGLKDDIDKLLANGCGGRSAWPGSLMDELRAASTNVM